MSEQPTDRVEVIAFCTKTGNIRQRVHCCRSDMHRHHAAFADHHFLDVTGQGVSPHDHVVDLATMKVVPRTIPTASDRRRKENEFRIAHEAQAPKTDAILAALIMAGAGDVQTVATLQVIAKEKAAADARLEKGLAAIAAAATRAELSAISW